MRGWAAGGGVLHWAQAGAGRAHATGDVGRCAAGACSSHGQRQPLLAGRDLASRTTGPAQLSEALNLRHPVLRTPNYLRSRRKWWGAGSAECPGWDLAQRGLSAGQQTQQTLVDAERNSRHAILHPGGRLRSTARGSAQRAWPLRRASVCSRFTARPFVCEGCLTLFHPSQISAWCGHAGVAHPGGPSLPWACGRLAALS